MSWNPLTLASPRVHDFRFVCGMLAAITFILIVKQDVHAYQDAQEKADQRQSVNDLIQNGSIDSAEHWITTSNRCSFDPDEGFKQKGSLLIDNISKGPADSSDVPFSIWNQKLDLSDETSGKLKIEAKLKATGFRDHANAMLHVFYLGENGTQIGFARGENIQKDCEWTSVSIVFQPPEKCKGITINVFMNGFGRLWIDDFQISSTTEPTTRVPFPRPPESFYWRPLRKSAEEIPWGFSLADATQRSKKSGKPVLVYVRSVEARGKGLKSAQSSLRADEVWAMEDGFQKDVMFRAGPLSDPDVSDLIQRRFIPVMHTHQFPLDAKSQFIQGVTGDDAVTPCLIVVSHSGEVVARIHRIGVYSSDQTDQWLRDSLKRGGAKTTAKDPNDLYRDGELEQVVEITTGKKDASSRLLQARSLTRLGRLAEAAKAIGELDSPAANLQRGVISMRGADWAGAISYLTKVDIDAAPELREQVTFRHAWCLHRSGAHSDALEMWRTIGGDSVMGRKALACLTRRQDAKLWMLGSERRWPRDKPLAKDTEVGRANEFSPDDSVEILLELQKEDGSWGWNDSGPLWSGAITALSAEALWRWRDHLGEDLRKRAVEAHDRGVDYLASITNRSIIIDTFNFPYMLDHLLRTGKRESAQVIVDHLISMQTESGAWSYRHDCVTSFNTADVLVALCKARDAGLVIPDESIRRGAAALDDMRSAFTENNFPYSPSRNFVNLAKSDPVGSIARDPMCEYALILAGIGKAQLHAAALRRFIEHEAQLRLPTKKYSGYFNKNALGSYFFFYAHLNALKSSESAPPELQKSVENAVLHAILSSREMDGSSIDNFMYGRAYGTAAMLVIVARIQNKIHAFEN